MRFFLLDNRDCNTFKVASKGKIFSFECFKSLLKSSLLLSLCFLLNSCATTSVKSIKINGVSFVASRDSITSKHIQPIININANYAAIMPFGFIKNLQHPNIVFDTERQWFGETKAGAKQYAKELKKQQIKIMIKPQIWIWKGEFTGNIKMNNEVDWKVLENAYAEFILNYADLAENIDADIYCIGTELEKFVENRPGFWVDLIKKVKAIYKGKLTYAANWNEYEKTPFWKTVDFIGIDAYFPVSKSKTPTVAECLEGWEKHKITIQEHSKKYNKPILFTEFGYRSVDFSGKAPWESDRNLGNVNMEAQSNTTQALFDTFWEEDWFAGGFIWKWFHNYERIDGKNNNMFTPQRKPVEAIIKQAYFIN